MSIPIKTLELLAQCAESRSDVDCYYYRIYLSKYGLVIDGKYVDKHNALRKLTSISYTELSCMEDNIIEHMLTKHIDTMETEFKKIRVHK